MIKLCWIEDGEWKQIELHYDQATRDEVSRIEKLNHVRGGPIAFLEHPVTYMLLPLFETLLPVRREASRLDGDEAAMSTQLARFIDGRDQSQRACVYVSCQLELANRNARVAELEADVESLRTQLDDCEERLA